MVVHLMVGDADVEPPPVGHRVPCVDRQVHQHLLQLVGVGHDLRDRRGRLHRDQGVLAQQGVKHGGHPLHELDRVNGLHLQHLLAAEGQQLTGEPAGPLAGLVYHGQVAAVRVVGRPLLQEVLADPDDDADRAVRGVARQRLDRQVALQVWLVDFELRRLAGLDDAAAGAPRRWDRLAMVQLVALPLSHLRLRLAEQLHRGPVGADDVELAVVQGDGVADGVEALLPVVLGLTQGGLDPLALLHLRSEVGQGGVQIRGS